jgi:hypothetical protein
MATTVAASRVVDAATDSEIIRASWQAPDRFLNIVGDEEAPPAEK